MAEENSRPSSTGLVSGSAATLGLVLAGQIEYVVLPSALAGIMKPMPTRNSPMAPAVPKKAVMVRRTLLTPKGD